MSHICRHLPPLLALSLNWSSIGPQLNYLTRRVLTQNQEILWVRLTGTLAASPICLRSDRTLMKACLVSSRASTISSLSGVSPNKYFHCTGKYQNIWYAISTCPYPSNTVGNRYKRHCSCSGADDILCSPWITWKGQRGTWHCNKHNPNFVHNSRKS